VANWFLAWNVQISSIQTKWSTEIWISAIHNLKLYYCTNMANWISVIKISKIHHWTRVPNWILDFSHSEFQNAPLDQSGPKWRKLMAVWSSWWTNVYRVCLWVICVPPPQKTANNRHIHTIRELHYACMVPFWT